MFPIQELSNICLEQNIAGDALRRHRGELGLRISSNAAAAAVCPE